MATSILEKVNIEKAAKNIKKTAKTINKEVINASDDFVDGAIDAGNEWTKVMEKAFKTGTILLGKQQDLVLDTLEGIKGQSFTGTKRFGKLIGFPAFTKRVKKARKNVEAKVAETRESIDEVLDKAMQSDVAKTATETATKVSNKAKAQVKKTRQSIDDVLESTLTIEINPRKTDKVKSKAIAKSKKATAKKSAKKVAKKVTKKVAPTAKKAVAKVTKPATKKVAKKVAKKVVSKMDDLKVIEGIGPKMAAILNDAGIKTFKQLATTKVTTVKEILAAAGPRYNMHNPTTWGKQAKLAAAGKMVELKKLQAKLKGEKAAK